MKKFSALICVLCMLLWVGCWDKSELEDQTFIVVLGLDQAEGGNITVTALFPLTQAGSGGGGKSEPKQGEEYSVMSATAPTVVEAFNLFGTKLAGPLSFFTAKTIVISEELAKEDLLRRVVSAWRYEQTRNNTNVLISACKASDFIKARLEKSPVNPLRQEDLILEQANHNAYYKAVQFLDLIIAMKPGNRDGVAMYGGIDGTESAWVKKSGYQPGEVPVKADNKSQISGLAVFHEGRMAGALDSGETQTYGMMTGSKTRKLLTLPDPLAPEGNIVVSILPDNKSDIKGYFVNGKPVFDIALKLNGVVECVEMGTDYEPDKNYGLLTEYVTEICAQNARELMTKLQKEYNADILNLGDKLAHNFLTEQEWAAYRWREHYKDAEIRVNVALDIDRAGILKP